MPQNTVTPPEPGASASRAHGARQEHLLIKQRHLKESFYSELHPDHHSSVKIIFLMSYNCTGISPGVCSCEITHAGTGEGAGLCLNLPSASEACVISKFHVPCHDLLFN